MLLQFFIFCSGAALDIREFSSSEAETLKAARDEMPEMLENFAEKVLKERIRGLKRIIERHTVDACKSLYKGPLESPMQRMHLHSMILVRQGAIRKYYNSNDPEKFKKNVEKFFKKIRKKMHRNIFNNARFLFDYLPENLQESYRWIQKDYPAPHPHLDNKSSSSAPSSRRNIISTGMVLEGVVGPQNNDLDQGDSCRSQDNTGSEDNDRSQILKKPSDQGVPPTSDTDSDSDAEKNLGEMLNEYRLKRKRAQKDKASSQNDRQTKKYPKKKRKFNDEAEPFHSEGWCVLMAIDYARKNFQGDEAMKVFQNNFLNKQKLKMKDLTPFMGNLSRQESQKLYHFFERWNKVKEDLHNSGQDLNKYISLLAAPQNPDHR